MNMKNSILQLRWKHFYYYGSLKFQCKGKVHPNLPSVTPRPRGYNYSLNDKQLC